MAITNEDIKAASDAVLEQAAANLQFAVRVTESTLIEAKDALARIEATLIEAKDALARIEAEQAQRKAAQ